MPQIKLRSHLMKFLSPKTDIAFKKLFGDKHHLDLTISFLNAILERQPGERIATIALGNTENLPLAPGEKKTFLDLTCTDEEGNEYIVEMEVRNKGNFLPRVQYYVSYGLARQLKAANAFERIHPVIFVGVLAYNEELNTDEYISHHRIVDQATGICSLKHSEYHFVQLNKFDKKVDQLKDNVADQWIYLIKNAAALEEVPKQLEQSKEIVEAFERLEFERLSFAEREAYIAAMLAETKQDDILKTAIKSATAEGEAKGKAEGERQKALAIAKGMLKKGIDIAIITEITGLSEKDVEEL
jgi:predicted transposase/invertase (TIGR01784 family)